METLKKLGIEIMPASKRIVKTFEIVDIDNEVYFGAEVLDDRDEFQEQIGVVFALNEKELINTLKNVYNVDYTRQRNLKNFIKWYEKITSKKLDAEYLVKIVDKFDY